MLSPIHQFYFHLIFNAQPNSSKAISHKLHPADPNKWRAEASNIRLCRRCWCMVGFTPRSSMLRVIVVCPLFIAGYDSMQKNVWHETQLLLTQLLLTIVVYLMSNPLCTYIWYIWFVNILLITFLNEPDLIFCTQLNGFKYFFFIWIILLTINHLFAHS